MKTKWMMTCVACFLARALFAQAGAALFLAIPADARSAGMGGGSTALPAGAFSIFHNPASIPFPGTRAGIGNSHLPWLTALLPGGFLNATGACYHLNERHAVATGFRYFAHAGSTGRDENATSTTRLHPAEWSVEAAHVYRPRERVGISITGRYVRSDMGEGGAGAVAFDAGICYRGSFLPASRATWAAGLLASNVGEKIRHAGRSEYLPARVTLGGAICIPFAGEREIRGTLDLAYAPLPAETAHLEASTGVEYHVLDRGSLRAGYHAGGGAAGSDERGTLGVGLCLFSFTTHLSYWITSSSSALRDTWSLSIEYSFPSTRRGARAGSQDY